MRSANKARQRRVLATLAGAVALASVSMLTACRDEPDNVGEAIEELGDEIEDAGDEIEDEIDDHS
ncbi:MAG: hypothetical protein ACHQ6V_14120 [Myxococcota bacterium]|jgi:hypothetical protein